MFSEQMLNEDGNVLKIILMMREDVVKDVIDRSHVKVPNTFVPSATQFAIANDAGLLYSAHPMGMYGISPRWGWCGGARKHLFEMYRSDLGWFSVRGYGCTLAGYKEFWAIEHAPFGKSIVQDVLALDSTPIFLTCPKIAKLIAQFCHPSPGQVAESLRWIPITT